MKKALLSLAMLFSLSLCGCDFNFGQKPDNSDTEKDKYSSLVSASISGSLSKTNYVVGEHWDSSGLVLFGTFEDSKQEIVNKEDYVFSFVPAVPTLETKEVEVHASILNINLAIEPKTFSVNVTNGKPIQSEIQDIELEGTLEKTNYYVGEQWDSTGLSCRAYYDDGSDKLLKANEYELLFDPVKPELTLKNVEITAKLLNKNLLSTPKYYPVVVTEPTPDIPVLVGIKIEGTMTVTHYQENDNWDSTGLRVVGIYSNEQEIELSNGTYTLVYSTQKAEVNMNQVTVYAVLKDGSFTSETRTFNVNVTSLPVSVERVSLNTNNLNLSVGDVEQLYATVYPDNAQNKAVYWESSDFDVVSVNNYGTVEALKTGSATITVRTADGNKTAICNVTVANVEATSISLNTNVLNLEPGNTETLIGTVYPENVTNKTISWSTSNSSVATVENGLVIAKSNGTAVITAECGSVKAACTVNVSSAKPEPEYITVSKTSFSDVSGSLNSVISYEAKQGTAGTAPAIYSAQIRIYQNGGLLDVKATSEYMITKLSFTTAMKTSYSHSEDSGTFSSSVSLAQNATGTIDNISANLVTIRCDGNDKNSRIYLSKLEVTYVLKGSSSIVKASSISISPSTKTIQVGTTAQLSATISPSNATYKTVNWSSTNSSVASVSDSGLLTANAVGKTTIYATAKDGSGVTGSCSVTVQDEAIHVTSVSLSKASLTVKTGERATLTATILPNDATNKNVSWSSSDTSVTTVSNGEVRGISVGTATITVKTADGNKTATCAVTVEQGEASGDDYYNSIDGNSSSLLSDLQGLNKSKRTRTVGYSSMGTSANGSFKYTDYDPETVKYDSKGQPYGTSVLSFYSGKSVTNFNREHVWPDSRGGGSVDNDIFMPRPTIQAENSNRGNSSYVEGMCHSQNGWDPVTAFASNIGVYTNIRGECARIIFYCVVANPNLKIVQGANTSFSNSIGDINALVKWSVMYSVNEREERRNDGGQYLQGNRNPFVDHPEYVCKIWGNTNATTKSACGLQ